MSTTKFRRRSFLQAVGLGSAFLPLFPDEIASAAAGTAKYFVAMQWPNGVRDEYWPAGSGTGFQLSDPMSPLAAHKQDILILDGIDNRAIMDQHPDFGGHAALPYLLTGSYSANNGGDGVGNSISIDQYIANNIQKTDKTEMHSLVTGVDSKEERDATAKYISFSGPAINGKPDAPPLLDDVNAAFMKLFTGTVPGGSSGMPGSTIDRLRWEKRSVWDLVHKDLDRFTARMGKDAKERMDAYTTAVRDIETQLDGLGTMRGPTAPPGGGAAKCESPADPKGLDSYNKSNYDKILKLQIEMTAAAFACGKTRVATILASNSHNNSWVFKWLGAEYSKAADAAEKFNDLRCHHQIAHLGSGGSGEWATLKNGVDKWFTGQYAYLIERLKYFGVFEQSLTMMMNCMGNGGSHSNKRLPLVLAGGGGYFKTGQLVKAGGKPHNGVLVAIAHAMGYPVDTFGDPKYGGHLPGIAA